MVRRLVLFACVLLVVQAAVYKLKVERHEGKGAKLMREGKPHEIRAFREAARIHYKFRLLHKNRPIRGNRLAASQPLYDYSDQAYTVNASIGTPPQQFNFYLDTFNGDTWVPDSTCSDDLCGCEDEHDQYCYTKHKFDSSASSTYVRDGRPFTDNNTGGTGFLGRDTFGLTSDLQIPKVTFGQLDQPYKYINRYPFDGILGLTYQSSDGVKSVIREAYNQKLLDKPIFTIYYGTDGSDSYGKVGGQITYGAVDADNCHIEDVKYVPVLSQNAWEFNVASTEISGKTQANSAWVGIADPSATFITIPQKPFEDVVAATGATFNKDYGIYQLDCNAKFKWNVILNGNQFTVDESRSLLTLDTSGLCFLAFENYEYPGLDFILGSPFVRDFCQVYDLTGNLGFAAVVEDDDV